MQSNLTIVLMWIMKHIMNSVTIVIMMMVMITCWMNI